MRNLLYNVDSYCVRVVQRSVVISAPWKMYSIVIVIPAPLRDPASHSIDSAGPARSHGRGGKSKNVNVGASRHKK